MGAIGVTGLVLVAAFVALEGVQDTRAQAMSPVQPVSVLPAGGGPVGTANAHPDVSASGAVVVFETTQGPTDVVAVRDRVGDTTRTVAEPSTRRPAVSANGCVVAYVVVGSPSSSLVAVDRCANPNDTGAPDPLPAGSVVGAVASAAGSPGAPALSADGNVIVWSTGQAIRRYERSGSSWAQTAEWDAASTPTNDVVTGPDVDVSDDGNVVVFTAGVGTQAFQPSVSNVYARVVDGATDRIDLLSATGAATPGAASSVRPVVSGDGSLVLFESTSTDLAGVPAGQVAPFVMFVDREALGAGVLASGARLPALSADGRHAVYERDGRLRTRSWASGAPFASAPERVLTVGDAAGSAAVGASSSPPRLSADGSLVVFDSAQGTALTSDTRFHDGPQIWSRVRVAAWQASSVQLGSSPVGAPVTGRIVVTNVGPTPIAVSSVTVSGSGFARTATTCTGSIGPGAACTVDARSVPTAPGNLTGTVTVRSAGGAPADAVGTITATVVGGSGSTTPTSPPTTAPPAPPASGGGDGGLSTVPIGTVPFIPPIFRPSGPVRPPFTSPTFSDPTDPFFPESFGAAVSFQPTVLDFAPTIAAAGERTASAALTNLGTDAATVVDVAINGAASADFALDGQSCVGVALSSGVTCDVTVAFAPTDEGSRTAEVVAQLADGTTAVLSLSGVGAPPPELSVLPQVAGTGQVVNVFGSGFPAGSTLVLHVGTSTREIVADDVGAFVTNFVVPERARRGPIDLVVDAVPGAHGEVTAELLVDSSGNRSGAAVFGGVGASSGR
jgi:hypothetical protein